MPVVSDTPKWTPSAWRLGALRRELVAEPGGYWVGALVTAVATGLALLAAPHAALAQVMVIYLLGAVLVSTRYGVAVSSFTIALSALCFDYFSIPPIFAFAMPDTHNVLTLVGMLMTAIVVCSLLHRLRFQRSAARASEARTLELCELSLDLSEVGHIEDLPAAAERHLARLFGNATRVLVFDAGAIPLGAVPETEREQVRLALADRKFTVEETPRGVLGFQPIASLGGPLGVIRVVDSGAERGHEREWRVMLAACADRIAVAIDRMALGDAARRAQVEAEAERLRNELLSAMSHDLRTPLASILTAGTTLLSLDASSPSARRELLETIVEETERLNLLVTNLLSVMRLESGKVRLKKTHEALDDLIFGVLSRLSGRLEGREVVVDVPRDLPLVPMDPVLIDQVLVNLIENVLRYTPEGSPLSISAAPTGSEILVEVADRGPGIDSDEREKVFERFYRGSHARQRDGGSGLGLTICRAAARAHGGRIAIRPRSGGGTVVEFALPATASGDDPRAGVPLSPSLEFQL
jgi:two-component system, OmpR family, sensor histidine kinase KdpD